MDKQLDLLITLHDVDLMIQEVEQAADEVASLGFKAPSADDLKATRDAVVSQLEPSIVARYDQLVSRGGRPVVLVSHGTCHGCFTALPTGRAAANSANAELLSCENCGRYLYWLR